MWIIQNTTTLFILCIWERSLQSSSLHLLQQQQKNVTIYFSFVVTKRIEEMKNQESVIVIAIIRKLLCEWRWFLPCYILINSKSTRKCIENVVTARQERKTESIKQTYKNYSDIKRYNNKGIHTPVLIINIYQFICVW